MTMQDRSKYSKIFLAFDLLFLCFYCAATYDLTLKPGLPAPLRNGNAGVHVEAIEGVAVTSDDAVEFVLLPHHIGDPVRVQTELDGRVTESSEVLGPYYSLWYVGIVGVVALLFFLLGCAVYFYRPADIQTVVFHAVSNCVAAALLGTKALSSMQPPWLADVSCALFLVSYSSTPALFVHFTFLFPREKRREDFKRRIGLYLPALALAAWQVLAYLPAAHSGSMQGFQRYAAASTVFTVYLFCSLAFGVVKISHSYLTAIDAADKKKLRWIMYGLSLGLGPYLFLWVLPQLLGFREWIPEEIFVIFLVSIPLTFAISIVRYHILDIDLLVNRSVVYGIVLGLLVAVYVVIVGGLAAAIGSVMTNYFLVAPVVASVVVALVFQPLRSRVQTFVDKRFFRVQYNFREAQRGISSLVQSTMGMREIADQLLRQLNEVLPCERVGLFAVGGGEGVRVLACAGMGEMVSENNPFDIGECVAAERTPVALEDYVEPGVAFVPADPEFFDRYAVVISFQLSSKAGQPLGILLMGPKKSGLRFTVEDVDLLNAVAAQIGLAMERITLQEKLILEHAESQRLEELNRLQSFFVSSVSHDLKTPLTSIKMFAELLQTKRDIAQEERLEYLQIIEGESDRLTRLINNVLDFSKIERGSKKYTFGPVSVNDVVNDVLRTMRYPLKMERFTVETHCSDSVARIRADRDAIVEALLNLLTNAMKYSGEVRHIIVRTRRDSECVAIDVQDHGIGIAEEDSRRIFEPFFRAHTDGRHGAGGAGLGLAIVNHIMDAHGGTVRVQSSPGEGSTFTLLFPVHDATGSIPT